MSVILWFSWPSNHPIPRAVLRSVSNHQITLPTAHGAELELKNTDFCQFSVLVSRNGCTVKAINRIWSNGGYTDLIHVGMWLAPESWAS